MAKTEKTVHLGVDTGNSAKDVDDVNKSLGKTGGAAGGAKKGLKGVAGGFKGLGMAWKALGIGAVIGAFKSLKSIFTGNIETARKLERMGAFLAASFDVVRDAVEPLFIRLIDGFSDPQQAIKDLWKALKENIVNRIQGVIDSFGALGKVIKGVFKRDLDLIKEGANEAKTSFIQLATGLDETQQKDTWNKLGKQIKQITEDIEKEGNAAMRLTKIMQDVRDEEREMLSIRAKANKQIAESRLLAEDDTKGNEERLEALKAAVAEEQRVAEIELAIQEKKVNAMQAMIDLGKSSEEDIQKLAEERARFIELQTASTLRQKRVAAEVGVFTAKVEKEIADAEKAKIKRAELLVQAKELELEIQEELSNKEIEQLIKTEEKKQQILEKRIEADKKMRLQAAMSIMQSMAKITQEEFNSQKNALKKQLDAGLITQEQFDKQTAKIEAEALKREKKAAQLQILLSTAQGIASAVSAGAGLVFPANLGAILSGIAAVIAGVAQGKAILNKVPGGGGGSGSDATAGGASPEGPSGIGGASLIPNMDAIIPEGQNGSATVQAYVLENDISDSQALQEELDIQSTL